MSGFRTWVVIVVLSATALRGVVTVHEIYVDAPRWHAERSARAEFAKWMSGPESREVSRGLGPFPN